MEYPELLEAVVSAIRCSKSELACWQTTFSPTTIQIIHSHRAVGEQLLSTICAYMVNLALLGAINELFFHVKQLAHF